ncbi:class I SAM-dependent methyltransferase [Candidatus Pacearchaeota archaeon]|nr:class I SAM-dependent methyltransferase [Candidatus Pacearchaeota archaeon]
MVKTRGLKEAIKKLGNLEKIISNMLKKKKKIRIFESGCGYGQIMIELKEKFGDKIDIVGMNYKPTKNDTEAIINFTKTEGKKIIRDLKKLKIKVILGNAGKKLPFKTGSIDLVYSQTSSYLYEDKMHFFEEVARILSKEGIARITPAHFKKNLPKEFQKILMIYDNGTEILFGKLIKRFRNIKLITLPSKKQVIEIKSGKLNFGLKLESTINTNHLAKKWFGIVSVYSFK